MPYTRLRSAREDRASSSYCCIASREMSHSHWQSSSESFSSSIVFGINGLTIASRRGCARASAVAAAAASAASSSASSTAASAAVAAASSAAFASASARSRCRASAAACRSLRFSRIRLFTSFVSATTPRSLNPVTIA